MKTPLVILALLLFSACGGTPFTSSTDPPDAPMDAVDIEAGGDGAPEAERHDGGHDGADDASDMDAVDGQKQDAGDAGEAAANDGCTGVLHDDGFGGHWTDCTPLGTFDFAEAMAACAEHTGNAKYCADLGGGTDVVCSNQDAYPVCACWAYAGALDPGYVNHGQDGCHPPGGGLGTDTAWQ